MIGILIMAVLYNIFRRRGRSRVKSALFGIGLYYSVPVLISILLVSVVSIGDYIPYIAPGLDRVVPVQIAPSYGNSTVSSISDSSIAIVPTPEYLADEQPASNSKLAVATSTAVPTLSPTRVVPTATSRVESTGQATQQSGISLDDYYFAEDEQANQQSNGSLDDYHAANDEQQSGGSLDSYYFEDPDQVDSTSCGLNCLSGAHLESRPGCDPSYPDQRTCIPPGPPFNQGCAITPERKFTVIPPDPQNLDSDKDGIGCEPVK